MVRDRQALISRDLLRRNDGVNGERRDYYKSWLDTLELLFFCSRREDGRREWSIRAAAVLMRFVPSDGVIRFIA